MKKLIVRILRFQAKLLLNKSNAKVVVVAGSVGKTTTTQAIATVLAMNFSVTKTIKNYNTDIGVPCSIIGIEFPESLKNPVSWAWLVIRGCLKVLSPNKTEVYVLELGTDIPGELSQFHWLKPDIAVITAVAPEHMEYFKDIEAVAREELSVAAYSAIVFINRHMISTKYLKFINNDEMYNYSREDIVRFELGSDDLQVIGEHSIDAVAAGIAVGKQLGMSEESLIKGAKSVVSQPGRMRKFEGVKGSILIDDTYNSSPEAVIAALDYLYSVDYPQKIALLGNMNELGDTSKFEHEKIGKYCDPGKLDYVVTLGPDANKYTAAEAEKKGCKVIRSTTPYAAASEIESRIKGEAFVLLKGSQNKVFAEEATKLLLKNSSDSRYLVRQSNFWQKIKDDCFRKLK